MKTLVPLVLAVAVLTACDKAPPPAAILPVVKTLVVGEAGAVVRSYSGEVRARHETPLAFRIGGKLVERRVDTGAAVKAGQVLARLDPADVALQAHQAEAQRLLALAEAKRYRDLQARNFVSTAALDARETTLAAADAQAAIARNQAAYAALAADQAGIVIAVLAEPGQVVSAGQPVLRLARDGEREVAIAVPEAVVAGLQPGQPAEVRLWNGARTYRGRLRELSPAADSASRTYAARIAIGDADAAVALGMTATVSFSENAAATPTVPLAALFQQGEGFAVWVVDAENLLRLKPVQVAGYTDAGASIAAGIAAGDRIVAAGVHKLTVGQKVRVAP